MSQKITILIVDDASINRAILKGIFVSEYNILEAENGAEAFKLLQEHADEIEIVLLDLLMPVMDGFTFLREIKKEPEFKELPVIITTTAGEKENELKALELGADNFIVKPYNPLLVKQCVHTIKEKYIDNKTRLENQIKEVQEQLDSLKSSFPGGVATFVVGDELIQIQSFNDGLCRMMGYSREEMEGFYHTDTMDFIVKEDRPIVRTLLQDSKLNYKPIQCKIRLIKKGGEQIWVGISGKRILLEDGSLYYQAIFIDLTTEKLAENKLQDSLFELRLRAEHDKLTGLYNREQFYVETENMLRSNPDDNYVMWYWNIDRFKIVNELFGSKVGDQILCDFANFLRRTIHGFGTYGRLDTDRFVTCTKVNFWECKLPEVKRVLSGEEKWNQLTYPVLLHVGLYKIEDCNTPVSLMSDRASMALESIKNNFITRFSYYNDDLRDSILGEQELVSEMETALETGQFSILLQPIVDVHSQKTISAEALVRWYHPTKGCLSPTYFIPVFEKNGFIAKIDMFVCEEVCKFQAQRIKNGEKIVPISVNLSRVNFYNPNLCIEILNLLRSYELSSDCLKLEITETAYKDNPLDLLNAVRAFQENGFKILMDDFGSGYSSLNMLKDICVDILKIDMKFMDELEKSDRARNILYSIIQMAKTLNMEIVVEGVESKSQVDLLTNMGCDTIQGYFFSKPETIQDFSLRLKKEENHNFEADYDRKTKTILVVDDQNISVDIIRENLKNSYNIIVAKDGNEAFDILMTSFAHINLILSDIYMPGMDGLTFLKKIQDFNFLKKIPVLMLTAYGDANNVSKAINLGALDVILKPFDPEILKKRINNILIISENQNVEFENNSLREDVALKSQIESMILNDATGICRFELGLDKDHHILKVLFSNGRFELFHNLNDVDELDGKAVYEFLNHILYKDRKNFMNELEKAIAKRNHFFQIIYHVEVKEQRLRKLISNITIEYLESSIILNMMVVDILECVNHTDADEKRKWREKQYQEIVNKDAVFFAEIDLTMNTILEEEENISTNLLIHSNKEEYEHFITHEMKQFIELDESGYWESFTKRSNLLEWYDQGEHIIRFDFRADFDKDYQFEWYTSTIYMIKNSDDMHVYGSWQIKSIQQEKMQMTKMKQLAEQDSLTNLYNRITYEKKVDIAINQLPENNKLSAFIMIDVDNFKAINDNFGHVFGDGVLRAVAQMLQDVFRKDDIIGRLGGDEFSIFIPRATSVDGILHRAQDVCDKSYIKFDNQGKEIFCSCSVGVAFNTERDINFKTLYIRADRALYDAKRNGKNSVSVYHEN